MPHAFDTSLSIPQRQLLRDAVVARLAPLTKTQGLYLAEVKSVPRVIGSGEAELEELVFVMGGQWPCVGVAVGRKTYETTSTTGARDRYRGNAILHVYAGSNNLRSTLARLAGDVVSVTDPTADPGVETILEHCEELLIGFQVPNANGSVYQLVPISEDELAVGADYVLFELQFEVVLQRDVKRYKGVTQLITSIRSRHYPDAVSFPKTDATILTWTASTKTIRFTAARPADMAVDAQIEIVTGAGEPRRATIASLVSTDSITVYSASDPVPAPGDVVYRVPEGLPTSVQELP